MQREKWQDIIGRIKDDFEVLDYGLEELPDEYDAKAEYIVFISPLGKIRLVLEDRPMILDKKTIYSNRIGAETKIEYIYSQSERNLKMRAWIFDESLDDWQEIEAKDFKF